MKEILWAELSEQSQQKSHHLAQKQGLGFSGGFFWLIFLSREGEMERSETFKLCVYLNIILLGLLQTLLVFPKQCGYSIIRLCHERKYYFLQCSRRHPLQSSSFSVI